MALTETQENDKIEVVRRWNVQVRTATVIKKDGTSNPTATNTKGTYTKIGNLLYISAYYFRNGTGNSAGPTNDQQIRWQSNSNSGTKLTLYSSNNTANWTSGYIEFSGSGTVYLS